MQSFDFSGRSVFVAGGTSGINLGIAEAFASAGANVAVLGRSPERLSEAERRLRAFGGTVIGIFGGCAQRRGDLGRAQGDA